MTSWPDGCWVLAGWCWLTGWGLLFVWIGGPSYNSWFYYDIYVHVVGITACKANNLVKKKRKAQTKKKTKTKEVLKYWLLLHWFSIYWRKKFKKIYFISFPFYISSIYFFLVLVLARTVFFLFATIDFIMC